MIPCYYSIQHALIVARIEKWCCTSREGIQRCRYNVEIWMRTIPGTCATWQKSFGSFSVRVHCQHSTGQGHETADRRRARSSEHTTRWGINWKSKIFHRAVMVLWRPTGPYNAARPKDKSQQINETFVLHAVSSLLCLIPSNLAEIKFILDVLISDNFIFVKFDWDKYP